MRGEQHSIAVAGGGIIGLSIAWRLAQGGSPVTVYDAGLCGREASWAGAGMLAPGGETGEDAAFARLLGASRALYSGFVLELERESGCVIDYQQCGALDVAYSFADWARLRERARSQAVWGIACKEVTPASLRAFWPRVRSLDLQGALFYPEDAIVNPRDLVNALRLACEHRGVRFNDNDAVAAIEVNRDNAKLRTVEGTVTAYARAIVASGAWSGDITVAGVPPLPKTHPVRGHLVGYSQPSGTCATIVRHRHTYLLQRANGLLIAGASMESAGFDRTVNPQTVAQLTEAAGFLLPHLQDTSPSETWVGFRPHASALLVDRWHSDRLLCAFGHFRNGILLAPWTAQRVLELVL